MNFFAGKIRGPTIKIEGRLNVGHLTVYVLDTTYREHLYTVLNIKERGFDGLSMSCEPCTSFGRCSNDATNPIVSSSLSFNYPGCL